MPYRTLLPESPALRDARMRPTAARIAVLDLLERVAQPLHADAVFRQLSDAGAGLALGTVYRALRDLEEGHLVQRDWPEEPCGSRKATYRLRRGTDPLRAVELVCMACGRETRIDDGELHRQLVHGAATGGMDLSRGPLVLRLAHCGCATSPDG